MRAILSYTNQYTTDTKEWDINTKKNIHWYIGASFAPILLFFCQLLPRKLLLHKHYICGPALFLCLIDKWIDILTIHFAKPWLVPPIETKLLFSIDDNILDRVRHRWRLSMLRMISMQWKTVSAPGDIKILRNEKTTNVWRYTLTFFRQANSL